MATDVRFITSAVTPDQYPPTNRPEIVVLGRSNAGKSSLLNAMSGHKIAYVSSTPGKTNLINFFDFGEHYRWVDVPGYGFSKRTAKEQRSWQEMVETYLVARPNLKGTLLVVDVRRGWSEEEADLIEWMRPMMLPWALVLTKADKLTRLEREKLLKKIKHDSRTESVFMVSSLKGDGIDELENFVFRNWIKE